MSSKWQQNCNSKFVSGKQAIRWESVVIYGNVIQNENLTGGQSPSRPPYVVGLGVRRQIGRSSSGWANTQPDDERPIRRHGGALGGLCPPS